MESYGTLLKKTREAKDLTIEQIERETTITRQYIEALEAEETDVFPGEAYMIGFLKNYADYLGAGSDTILKLYHAKKIQESPVPRELLEKHPPKFLLPLIIILSILLLAGVGCYLYFFVFKVPQLRIERALQKAETKKVHQYELTDAAQVQRVYVGDQLLVPAKEGEGKIVLTISQTLEKLSIQTPLGNQKLDLAEERSLDVDGDNEADIILYLWDISNTDESRGAEVRMRLKGEGDVDILFEEPATSATEASTPATRPTTAQSATAKQKVLLSSSYTYPFTVNITFLSPCLLRYRIDSEAKVERYYKAGETLSLNARYRGVRLWMSNHYAVQIQVVGSDGRTLPTLVRGKAGQVQVESIRWVGPRTDGKYYIVVEDVD